MPCNRGVSFKFEGGREIQAGLAEIGSKVTRRNTARRALEMAGEPIRDEWERGVHKDSGLLKSSIAIGKAAKKEWRGGNKGDRVTAFVGVNIGAGERGDSKKSGEPILSVYAKVEELGNETHAANPAGRHAYETKKQDAVDRLTDDLRNEITATTERASRKAARKAAKG